MKLLSLMTSHAACAFLFPKQIIMNILQDLEPSLRILTPNSMMQIIFEVILCPLFHGLPCGPTSGVSLVCQPLWADLAPFWKHKKKKKNKSIISTAKILVSLLH